MKRLRAGSSSKASPACRVCGWMSWEAAQLLAGGNAALLEKESLWSLGLGVEGDPNTLEVKRSQAAEDLGEGGIWSCSIWTKLSPHFLGLDFGGRAESRCLETGSWGGIIKASVCSGSSWRTHTVQRCSYLLP